MKGRGPTYFIDAATVMEKVRRSAADARPRKSHRGDLTFSSYREVNGVKLPFAIDEARSNAQEFVHYTTKIEANTSLDDSLFKSPAPKP